MKRQFLSTMAVGMLAGSVLGAVSTTVVSTSTLTGRTGDVTTNEVRSLEKAADLQSFAYTSSANWSRGGDASAAAVVRVTPMASAADWPTSRWLPAGAAVSLQTAVGEGQTTFAPTVQRRYKAEMLIADEVVGTAWLDLSAATDLASPTSLASAEITLSAASLPCTGFRQEPVVTVRMGETVLTEGVDFTLVFENNIRVGTARVLVVGIGAYKDIVERTFSIVPLAPETVATSSLTGRSGDSTDEAVRIITHTSQLLGIAWTSSTNWLSGGDGEVQATVAVSAMTGDADADPASWIPAGQPEPIVSSQAGEGIGFWTPTARSLYRMTLSAGAETVETAYFNLMNCADISAGTPVDELEIALSAVTVSCDGSEKRPSVTVLDEHGDPLAEGVGYSLAYSDNFYVGTATVTVYGMGSYSGSYTTNFTIVVQPPETLGEAAANAVFDTRADAVLTYRGRVDLLPFVWNSAADWKIGGTNDVTATVSYAPLAAVEDEPSEGAYVTLSEAAGEGQFRYVGPYGLIRIRLRRSDDPDGNETLLRTLHIGPVIPGLMILLR